MTALLRQSALIDMDHSYVDVYLDTLEMDDFAMARTMKLKPLVHRNELCR